MSDNYISEFVGLRSKMYALRTEAGGEETARHGEVRKCKGVKKNKSIYYLITINLYYLRMNQFQSNKIQ